MLPEIADRLKGLFSTPEPVSLNLNAPEQKSVISIDQSANEWYYRNGFYGIANAGGYGSASWSGERVSLASAQNHSVVWACRRIICEPVGFIPLVMMQQANEPGSDKTFATGHPMYRALKNAPNEEMTAMDFRETLTGHCVLQGNGFAQILRRSGTKTAIELHLLQPGQVRVERDQSARLVYVLKTSSEQEKTYTVQRGQPHDILHIRGIGGDGISGQSVISVGAQSMGTAIAAEKSIGGFFGHGGRVAYNLKFDQPFKTEADGKKFRSDWEEAAAIPHRAPILPPNISYQQTGLSLKDAQLLETRLFGIHEICRWFGVSPHLVGDLSRATFSNIEQLALEFVKLTLSAWLKRWEEQLWRCVLTPEEKNQGYFWRHNLNALVRGDLPSRMAAYSTMLQNGIASPNEIRDLEDWNSFEGGDTHRVQLNMQVIPADGSQPVQDEVDPAVATNED